MTRVEDVGLIKRVSRDPMVARLIIMTAMKTVMSMVDLP